MHKSRAVSEKGLGLAEDAAQVMVGACYGCRSDDLKRLRIAGRLIENILIISQTLAAFHATPRREIGGKSGVSHKLKLSRHSVYVRLKLLGLTKRDFLQRHANTQSLMQKSRLINKLARQLWP